MQTWPDEDQALIEEFLDHLGYAHRNRWSYRSMLRLFQKYVGQRKDPTSERSLRSWIATRSRGLGRTFLIQQALFVRRFLDWLLDRGLIRSNPFRAIQDRFCCQSTAAIVRALISRDPESALEALRPPPRYASHLGSVMREHVERMRVLGFRYSNEDWFLRFDRFLQRRRGAETESFSTLARDYIASASTAAGKLHRLSVTRVVAKALQRAGTPAAIPARDRLLIQQADRSRLRPHIYSVAEIKKLLDTAQAYESDRAPLRAATVHCMIGLAYCAGLRLSELVGLQMKDVDLEKHTIEIRNTKFFKSRCLPLTSSANGILRQYVARRHEAGISSGPETPLFCHARGGYSRVRAGQMLREVIVRAGLKPTAGRTGPRIHDLRHTFVVHRMTQWYEERINPQQRLPYLATYLGHRDIHSTLIYLTVTQELLQKASERFRLSELGVTCTIKGKRERR